MCRGRLSDNLKTGLRESSTKRWQCIICTAILEEMEIARTVLGRAPQLTSRRAALHRAANKRYYKRRGLRMFCSIEYGDEELNLLERVGLLPKGKDVDRHEVARLISVLLRDLYRHGK